MRRHLPHGLRRHRQHSDLDVLSRWHHPGERCRRGRQIRPIWFHNPFGHQQGAWTATADYAAKATTLHVQFAGEFGPAQGPVRTDTTYTFTSDCTTINAFAYDLRFYGTGQDPLDPTDGTPGFSGTGTGRLLTTGI